MAKMLLAQACLLVTVLAELASSSSQRLEDSAALVQTLALIKDESTEEKPPHIRPLRELLTEASQKWATKSEEAGQKWLARQQDKLQDASQKIKDKVRSLSEPPTEKPPQKEEPTDEEKKTAKYGAPINLVVMDPMNREYEVKFRQNTKLHALFNSLIKRNRLRADTVSFARGPQLLRGNDTAMSAGLIDGDVIELRSDALLHKREKQVAQEKAAARRAQVLEEKEEAARLEKERKIAAREKLLADYAAEQAAKKAKAANRTKQPVKLTKSAKKELKRIQRKRSLQTGHMVDLKFVDDKGKEVQVGFKRENAFGPLQKLISKRFGLKEGEAAFYWNNEFRDVPIHANSTVHGLRLPNHAVIKVRPVVQPEPVV